VSTFPLDTSLYVFLLPTIILPWTSADFFPWGQKYTVCLKNNKNIQYPSKKVHNIIKLQNILAGQRGKNPLLPSLRTPMDLTVCVQYTNTVWCFVWICLHRLNQWFPTKMPLHTRVQWTGVRVHPIVTIVNFKKLIAFRKSYMNCLCMYCLEKLNSTCPWVKGVFIKSLDEIALSFMLLLRHSTQQLII